MKKFLIFGAFVGLLSMFFVILYEIVFPNESDIIFDTKTLDI